MIPRLSVGLQTQSTADVWEAQDLVTMAAAPQMLHRHLLSRVVTFVSALVHCVFQVISSYQQSRLGLKKNRKNRINDCFDPSQLNFTTQYCCIQKRNFHFQTLDIIFQIKTWRDIFQICSCLQKGKKGIFRTINQFEKV